MTSSMRRLQALCFALLASQLASGEPIGWVDWQIPTAVNVAKGKFADGVEVQITGPIQFQQIGLGQVINNPDPQVPFTNFWTETIGKPYTGNPLVSNPPTPYELIALERAGTTTVTFSKPVIRPLLAIVSLGSANNPVTYSFDKPFTVLSTGAGYWGGGSFTKINNSLTGREFHGLIQFQDTVSSISWTTAPNEYWHGFTFGQACYVPSGETIKFHDCTGGLSQCWGRHHYPTAGVWVQTLTRPPGMDFHGRAVREVTAAVGSDSCHFNGSALDEFVTIPSEYTATPVPVTTTNGENTYEDEVGWSPAHVSYYRAQGRAPCQFTIHQLMQMQCPNGSWKTFVDYNTLSAGITPTAVWSSRVGPGAPVIERIWRRW